MELRHLRRFMVLAEELHFTRAAERLFIEQPPLSRAIKELENKLGVLLFERDRRGTRLTAAGASFFEDTRRLFILLERAKENAKAVASGLQGSLRVAVSDGALDFRLSAFLARCREEEPEVEMRMVEVPLAEQVRGLRSGDFAMGFAHTADVGEGIFAEAIWQDPLVIVVPARHSLLAHKRVPLNEVRAHPLVLSDPQMCEGYCRELIRLLQIQKFKLNVVEETSSLDMMLTLVGAGYGIGFMKAVKISSVQRTDVVTRPLDLELEAATITTYLLRSSSNCHADSIEHLVNRLRDLG